MRTYCCEIVLMRLNVTLYYTSFATVNEPNEDLFV